MLVAQSCLSLYDPMDYSLPDSSVYGILQAKYWTRYPFPSPGDLLDSGVKPMSPVLKEDSLPSEPPISKHIAISSSFSVGHILVHISVNK